MSASPDCPAVECWQALFNEAVPPEQRAEYERHLESCAACQARLDRAEEGGEGILNLLRRSGGPDATPPDPALSRALERLHNGKSLSGAGPAEPADLYFLRPSERPGVLGTVGDYEVREVIGQGGMGVVLKAFDPGLNRFVAIKVMAAAVAGSATARRRFTREARAAAAVCHEHVVAVHGVHEIDGLPYLVMQYVAGESLQDRINRTGPLDVEDAVRIGMQAASGLAAAHAQGLIHRDIKPANVLLENGLARVKITDFGLARMADGPGLTQAGVVAGTPEYMAPEQARGEQVDPRADLFSLGSVLYACCTGLAPFRGPTAVAVVRQVIEETPVPIRVLNPEVPAWLEAVIARLMAKNPAERFQSAGCVADLLDGYLTHLRQPASVPAPELPATPAVGRSRGARSDRRVWLGVVLLLATFGLFGFLMAQAVQQGGELRDGTYYDFRGRPVPPNMVPFGTMEDKFVKVEAEGLRITLPRGGKEPLQDAGFDLPLTIAGDFAITAGIDILQAEEPPPGAGSYGVGVMMSVNQTARVGRLSRANGQQVLSWDRWGEEAGKRKWFIGATPCADTAGRLRLKRTGTTLHFQWAPGMAEEDFKEIYQFEFGDDEITLLRLGLTTYVGRITGALDVRLVDLKIESPSLAADEGPSAEERRTSWAKRWGAPAGVVLVVILLSLAVFLVVRRRRAGKPALGPAPRSEARAESAAPSVSARCSGCGKAFKCRVGLAGKKVKCPQCGQTVLVPRPPS
jgi:DNA-directed RNA polymerase subunit RPC12/RpoP